ncbi:MAG: MucR family transcriptional regulator [Desulfohalobiaceae bacterium]
MQEHVQEALQIIKAQAKVRSMSEEEMASMLHTLSSQLKGLLEVSNSKAETEGNSQAAATDPNKAIREKTVVCLECGKKLRVLNKLHLAKHGLSPAEYKAKWGYSKNTALISKSLARQRRDKIKEMELWTRRKNVNINRLTEAILQDFENNHSE